MKTNQNHSHGLARLSRLHLTSKNSTISATTSNSKQTASISNYFTTKKSSEEEAEPITSTSPTSECFDSPYKKALTKIKYVPPNDDPNDFKTPQAVKPVRAFQPNVTANKQNKSRKPQKRNLKKTFSRKGNYILKITKDNFEQSDVNPDHLQLALALSKSTYAAENPERFINAGEEDLPTILSPKKIGRVKTTLEKYGFKSAKSKLSPEHKRDLLEVPRKNRPSKFRFLTPTLEIRTDEERESIIASKISLILCQNKNFLIKESESENDNELFSNLLTKFYYRGGIIFTSNRLTLQETENFTYYSRGLNISPTKYQCGCLLKKWEDIPGREMSPDRSKTCSPIKSLNKDSNMVLNKYEDKLTETTTTYVSPYKDGSTCNYDLSKESPSVRDNCISPDLFNSDSELNCSLETSENDVLSQSSSNLSSIKILPNLTGAESSKSHPNDCEIERLKISNYDIPKTDTGIQHFESCYDDVENFSQKVYFLNKYSKNNGNDDNFEELCLNSLIGNEKPVVYDLTQSSSSDEDTSSSFKGKIIDSESVYRKGSSNDISRKFINETNKKIVYDSTQNSSSNEGTSKDFNGKTNGTKNLDNKNPTEAATLMETDINFDESPLQIHNSKDYRETTNVGEEVKHIDTSQSVLENMETFDDVELGTFDSTKLLNVTDYVNQILNEDNSITNQGNNVDPKNSQPDGEINLSQGSCSQDSIVISDEELNYSSARNKDTKNNKSFYELSDGELDGNFVYERDFEEIIVDSGNNEHPKNSQPDSEVNLSQGSCSQESIIISDEELNYSSVHSKGTNSNKSFYDLPDDEVDENCANNRDIEEISNIHSALKNKYGKQEISLPVHNRVTELKNKSSLAKATLEDSFIEVFEDTNILKVLENEAENNKSNGSELANVKTCNNRKRIENVENNYENITPEKGMFHTGNSIVTPENTMIIKTKDITPMLNYDEMDTPKVTKELQKFGLKPLKRQRGIKLLKYLYDSTHPLVASNETEELSSDEDDRRVFKKKKKCNQTTDSNKLELVLKKQGVLENLEANEHNVCEGYLLENENSDQLIFERKYPVKTPSCRVPLHIVWHNFVCNNPIIKENILLYEPLQLEVLHCMLKEQSGCKFHVQDLLTFLDKKCVTIRTGQTQGRRKAKK